MQSNSSIYNEKVYLYNHEKRRTARVKFSLDVYYPRVNDKLVHETINPNSPLMQTINISETGICFSSKVPVYAGDFVSFLVKLGDAPSFFCIAKVMWIAFDDENFLAGSEFIALNQHQTETIRSYVKQNMI